MASKLDQLKQFTTAVGDTRDLAAAMLAREFPDPK